MLYRKKILGNGFLEEVCRNLQPLYTIVSQLHGSVLADKQHGMAYVETQDVEEMSFRYH